MLIDGTTSTKSMTLFGCDRGAVEDGLRCGRQIPSILCATEQTSESGRQDDDVTCRIRPSFEEMDAEMRIFGQAIGKNKACNATSNDHYICMCAVVVGD
jgi:hypothetical protein